jgi:voltage-gated potassium channel Kch
MRKLAFAMLVLVSLSFAAWQSYAVGAMMIAVALLGVIFMAGMGFDIRELQILAKDELHQILVLALLMLLLFGTDNFLNGISETSAFTLEQPTLQDAAVASLDETMDSLSDLLTDRMASADRSIIEESSKVSSCYIVGGGYSVTSCGGYSMLSAPLSMGGSIVGYAIAEAAAIKKLILIAQQAAFTFILPLGIILRTFRFTRGAGGFLIAFAISLYILVPGGIVFVELLEEEFDYYLSDVSENPDVEGIYREPMEDISVSGCNPGDPWGDVGGGAADTYESMRTVLKQYLYVVLVKATLGPVLSLLLFVGGLRALTALFGAPVDVSAIARFF